MLEQAQLNKQRIETFVTRQIATRARLSSAQLTTYYFGFTEHLKLRKEVEKTPGFTERAYHDKLLSFGSPSMKIIRQLMTKK